MRRRIDQSGNRCVNLETRLRVVSVGRRGGDNASGFSAGDARVRATNQLAAARTASALVAADGAAGRDGRPGPRRGQLDRMAAAVAHALAASSAIGAAATLNSDRQASWSRRGSPVSAGRPRSPVSGQRTASGAAAAERAARKTSSSSPPMVRRPPSRCGRSSRHRGGSSHQADVRSTLRPKSGHCRRRLSPQRGLARRAPKRCRSRSWSP